MPQVKKLEPAGIITWKKLPIVKECYEKLFTKGDGELTYIERIIGKYFPETKNPSDYLVTFAISIVTIILNPKSFHVKVESDIIVPLLKKNLVSVKNFYKNRINFTNLHFF